MISASEAMSSAGLGMPARPRLDLGMGIPCTTSPMFPGMLKLDKSVYSSPPPAANTPENNHCRLIDYRSHKVAAFTVDGRELICLPQAFELFLKNLVGGLHTVYTKLKRLGITPIVCNVEQVRILRGLGAIQPGVNRCKLIAPKEFDVLYDDCTNSSARPGRPPKRNSPSPGKTDSPFRSKLPRVDGDLGSYPSPYKWMDIMKTSQLLGNSYYYPPQMTAAHLQFMHHPAMLNMAFGGPLAGRTNGLLDLPKDSSGSNRESSRDRSGDRLTESDRDQHRRSATPRNEANSHDSPVNLNIKDSGVHSYYKSGSADEQDISDQELSDEDLDFNSASSYGDQHDNSDSNNGSEGPPDLPSIREEFSVIQKSELSGQRIPENGLDQPADSFMTVLLNMQGLLRMAIESARHKDSVLVNEKADLRRQLAVEKERRQQLESKISGTQKYCEHLQRKLRKERRLARRLQESLRAQCQSHVHSAPIFPTVSVHSSHQQPSFHNAFQSAPSGGGGRMRNISPLANGHEAMSDPTKQDKNDKPADNNCMSQHCEVKTEKVNGYLSVVEEQERHSPRN